MTLYAVQKFLYELNRTPALQTAYEEDRHAVLEPFDLTEEETSVGNQTNRHRAATKAADPCMTSITQWKTLRR